MPLLILMIASLFLNPFAQETPEVPPEDCKSLIALFYETDEDADYFLLDGDTFEETQIMADYEGVVLESLSLDWSPDGLLLVSAQMDAGGALEEHLFLYNPASGEVRDLVAETTWAGQFSPTGQIIAFYSYFSGTSGDNLTTKITLVETGQTVTISQEKPLTFKWGAEGNLLYLTDIMTGDVSTIDLNVEAEARPFDVPGIDTEVYDVFPSPDGESLAVITSPENFLYVVDLATEEAQLIELTAPVYGLVWSPDGSRFAFDVSGELYLHEIGGETTPLTLPEELAGTFPTIADWSPDGERLLINASGVTGEVYTETLYVLTVADGTIEELRSNEGRPLWAQWSPCLPDGE